jgi:long-subunit fatty acid transport protein
MNFRLAGKITLLIVGATLCSGSIVFSQPAAGPLDVQGLDQTVIPGTRSRAMGGTTVANSNDASALFSNPAALSRVSSFEIRAGGVMGKTHRKQTQEWVPYMSNPALSVLFESLTDPIPIPLDSLGNPLTAWKTLQRQYDNITPDWDRSSSAVQPFSLAAALPFILAEVNITAGIGISQALNLDHYYQNNNSLSPYMGQLRPDPKIITKPLDTVNVQWYQYIRERKGIVYGITPGISVTVLPGLTLGGSATILTGSSDDNERRVERGHLYIATNNKSTANDFLLDTVYYQRSMAGTSTYSGKMLTVGLLYQQDLYSIGITIKPSHTLTRTWERTVTSLDTTKKSFPVRIDTLTSRSYRESGRESLLFPLAFSLGLVLTPTDKWTIACDYEMRNPADMELSNGDAASRPWTNKSATMRFGAEYRPTGMLACRAGYREDIQVFSPDGSAVIGEPARGGVYSLGAGLTFGKILMDIAYEYSLLRYQDIYQSNVNSNQREQHQFLIEFAYRF